MKRYTIYKFGVFLIVVGGISFWAMQIAGTM